MAQPAIVKAIYVAQAAGAPMSGVDQVTAIKGKGLDGDRYAADAGHYSNIDGWGAQVTLIQSEAIDAVNKGHETDYTGAMLRRNLVTQGIQLKQLLGQNFRCGGAILRGTKMFPPCMRLAQLLGRRNVLQYFSHCGGIGAEVVQGGAIHAGDEITILDPARELGSH